MSVPEHFYKATLEWILAAVLRRDIAGFEHGVIVESERSDHFVWLRLPDYPYTGRRVQIVLGLDSAILICRTWQMGHMDKVYPYEDLSVDVVVDRVVALLTNT